MFMLSKTLINVHSVNLKQVLIEKGTKASIFEFNLQILCLKPLSLQIKIYDLYIKLYIADDVVDEIAFIAECF